MAVALRALLEETPDIQLVAQSQRGGDVVALVRRTWPDVLLLDLFIEPEFDALATVRHLHADFPDLKICLLSAYLEPPLVRDLLEAGVGAGLFPMDSAGATPTRAGELHDAFAGAGRVSVPPQIAVKSGDRLLTVRGSGFGLGFVGRGPIY